VVRGAQGVHPKTQREAMKRAPRSAEAKRAIRKGTQRAAQVRAERLRCPRCSRKAAMVRLPCPGTVSACRYCNHEINEKEGT